MLYLSEEEEEEMPERTENDPLVTPGSSITTLNDVAREMSVQEVLDKGKFNVIDVLYIIALGLIAIADSMQACYVAIVIPDLTCLWSLSASQQSLLTSLTFLGTGVGGVFIGPLSDRFGRKTSAMVTTIVLFFTMTLTATSPNFYVFLVFSVTAGICIGGSLTIAFTYWAEVSSTSNRKLGITVITTFWNFGIMVSYGIAYLSLNSIGWKTFSYIMAIPALIPAIILAFLPESPKYLNSIGDIDGTVAALRTKLKTSCPEFNLDEITILKEARTRVKSNLAKSILQSFKTICSSELRCDTLRVIGIYSCLQIVFKGLLYITTAIFATNRCETNRGHKVWGSNPTDNMPFGKPVQCATLDDADLVNGALLSFAFHASTILTMILVKRVGEYWTLRLLSVSTLFFSCLLIFCIPGHIQLVSIFMIAVGVAGISLVFFIILPQIYPTIARNSGFGLVDGVGKIVASLAVYAITTIINYSLRAAICVLVGMSSVLMVQILVLRNLTETSEEASKENELQPHQD